MGESVTATTLLFIAIVWLIGSREHWDTHRLFSWILSGLASGAIFLAVWLIR